MRLDKKEADEETDVDTTSVEAAFVLLMRWLHRQPEFTPEMLKDEEVQQFIRTHAEVLDDAVDFSIRQRPLDDISVQRLKESNYVFSGFKAFHELNEAFPSLLDADGNRKPFERFLNDVQKVNENYNKYYLKAEYNFAMASADMAAKWQGWWDDEDRDRYLLQYRTVGDKRVRESHRLLHNVTLPITSKFWDEYFPPNNWNCRCTVTRVLRRDYPESNEQEAMLAGSQATAGKHQEMMRFNPGKQMACFPAYNPYTISKCKNCPNRPGTMKLAKEPRNELCAACKVIREMKTMSAKATREQAKPLQGKRIGNPDFPQAIVVSGKGIKEWSNQPHMHYFEKNRMLLDIENVLAKSQYLGALDYHKNEDVTVSHIFETEIKGDKSWIIAREYKWGEVVLHSISDSPKIKELLKKK